jgi:hypothetical protein
MAGEDVLLRIGADLTAYEAALKRVAELAGQVPQISIVPPGALSAATAYTGALQGISTASKAVESANTSLVDAYGRLTKSQQESAASAKTVMDAERVGAENAYAAAKVRIAGAKQLSDAEAAAAGVAATASKARAQAAAQSAQQLANIEKAGSDAAVAASNRRMEAGNQAAAAAVRNAAAVERAAITQYQQQQKLAAQQASLQQLPQSPAVVRQLEATRDAMAGLTQQTTLAALPLRQLVDANDRVIKSFAETEKRTRSFIDPAMIGRVIAVGLAFKGLTLAIDLLKGLGDVDKQLSTIAGTIDNLDDRQRILTESSRMIFDVMAKTGRSADEAGQLVLNLQRAVGDNAETLNAIYIPALALTVQKETDAAATIQILIGLYNNFGTTLQGVTTQQQAYLLISDMIVTAANKSAVGIGDFVTALNFASNAGKNAQVPLQDLLAMMSLMGERSVRASTIGTGLRQVFEDLVFSSSRVAAAFEIAVDAANPQPYVLLQTIMKQLGTEFTTSGKLSADSLERIKKAFPNTQELAGFNVLFQIFPDLAERANQVATGFGASQRILDEFRKSVGAAASALTAELLQALDALFGGDIPGKFEGIAAAVDRVATAFRSLAAAIRTTRGHLEEFQKASLQMKIGGQGGLFGGLITLTPEQEKEMLRQIDVLERVQKLKKESSGVQGPPSPYLGPPSPLPSAITVPVTPTVNPATVKTGLDKLKGDLDNIIREKTLGNIEVPIGVRIGVAQKDRAEAQKIVDEITAKVAKGVPYDADAQKAFKEAQTNVENMTNKIAALNKEGAELAKKQLTLSLKAPEGQSIDDIITQALGEYKDKDIILPVRIQMAEGALEAAKAELARVRAIAEQAGVGEETRPALKAAAARVGTATVELNKLQDESTKIMVAGVNKAIEAEEKLGKVISEVNAELNKQSIDAQASLGAPTEFAQEMAKITQESLTMIAKIYSTIDQGVDEATVLKQIGQARQTEVDKRQAYLDKIVAMTKDAAGKMQMSLEEEARPKSEALLLSIKVYSESLSEVYRKLAGDLEDAGEQAAYVAVQTGRFIDKLTETDLEERKLAGLKASFHLSGVEAEIAQRAIVQFGMSIEEMVNHADPAFRRLAESIRRGAIAAREQLTFSLDEVLKGTAATGAGAEIVKTNEALEQQISRLGAATSALDKYNNRARDTAIAQAQLDAATAQYAGDTLGYLAARLREATAEMKPLLESIGDGLVNVLKAAERATSDFFFEAFQGNIKSAKEAFADFGKSILRELSNVLASAVVKDFLGLFTGKGFSGEGLIGGLIGAIASIFGAGGSATASGVAGVTPGVGSGPGAVYGPPSFETMFGAGAGTGANASIAALTGSITTLIPGVLSIAGALGVPGAGMLGGLGGLAPLLKEIPAVFRQITSGYEVVESVLGGLERIGVGGGVGAAGSIIGLIGGMIGDRDVALAGSLVSALGTFSKIAYGIGELVYSAATGGVAAALGSGAIGFVDAGSEIVAGAGLLSGVFDGLVAGGGVLSGAFEALGAVFSAFSAVALPLAVVSLPLVFGFFEDMGREEIAWKRLQKERASAGFTGDVYRRGATLEQQMQTGGPRSVKQEIETNETIRRDLSILAAEAINIAGFMGPAVAAVKTYGENVMMEAQKVLVEGFGGMSFETASIITSITHDVMTEPQRILDELNYFLMSVEKFGIKAANVDLDIGIGKNWQGALGAISGVQQVIEAYNDLFELIDPSSAPGGGPGTPGAPPVSDETRKQNQLLLNTALAVNVAFKLLTDSLGRSQQAAVEFGEVIDGIPTTLLKFGSATVEITHKTEDEINQMLAHMGETLNFEQFVTGIKKITDVLKLPALAEFHPDTGLVDGILLSMKNLSDVLKNMPIEYSPTAPVHDLPPGVGSDSASLMTAEFGEALNKGLIDITTLSKIQLDYLRKVIIEGLTKALVAAPEKIVGIMNLEKLKKEGETVEQAGQRLGTAFVNIGAAMKRLNLQADLAAGRTDEVTLAIKAYDKAQVDMLTAAGPEELLAAIGALEEAIPRVFKTMIDAVQKLDAEIHRIDLAIASAVTEFLKFSVVAETLDLSKATGAIQDFYYSLSTLEGRLAALPAVIEVISDSARRAADATYFVSDKATGFNPATGGSPAYVEQAIQDGLLAMLPLADILVNTLNEAASIKDPVARMQGINAFVGQVDQLYQSLTAGIHAMYERAREDVHAIFDAERERISKMRTEGQKAYDTIQKGLRDQKESAQKQSQDAIEKIREESDERLKALQKQKEAGQKQSREYIEKLREATDLQKEALQAQISALEETLRVSEEWEAAANRIRDTILDLTLSQSSHITNPQQRLALAQAQFTGAQATFAASPTPEAAERVSEMGQRVIAALEELFPRAGGKFESESQKVLLVLQAAQNAAQSRVGPQEEMNRSLVAMRKHLEEIEKTAQAQIKEAEKLTEAFVEEMDRLIEAQRDDAEKQIKWIEDQTEAYIEGIDKQIEANEKAMEAWLEGLVQWEKDLAKAEKDWLEYLSVAERRDIQGIKNGLAPLMQKAADEMEKARKEAERQREALELMRDGITGGTPVDIFIAARTADMVALQGALPSQIEAALARQVGAYLVILLQSLGFHEKGTASVPHTTLAQVHKGEMIITAGDADVLRRYGIRITGGGGGAIEQNNFFNISGVRDPEGLVDMLADRVVEKLRGSIGSDIIQRSNGRRW